MLNKYITPCLHLFIRNKFIYSPIIKQIKFQKRYSSYQASKTIENIGDFKRKFQTTKDPEDWIYVERLLPPLVVPNPLIKNEYASGWRPPADTVPNEKYFVPRTRNHMIPVYLTVTFRGMRKITEIKKIEGDVFELEKQLKNYLTKTINKEVATQTNEFAKCINIKGDHVNLVKDFLLNKGF